MRHRFAVTNWLTAAYRTVQLVARHATHLGATLPKRVATGEVVAIGTSDLAHLGNAMDVIARAAGALVSFLVVAVILLRTSVTLGVLVLVGVPLLLLLIGPLLKPLQRRNLAQREMMGELSNLATDIVSGLRVLRGIGGERVFHDRYVRDSQRVRRAGVQVGRLQSVLDALQILLPGVFVVLVVWLGARFAVQGRIASGELVAFYGYAAFLMIPLRTATEFANKWIRAFVAARRVVRVLSLEPEIAEPQTRRRSRRTDAELVDVQSGLRVPHGPAHGVGRRTGRRRPPWSRTGSGRYARARCGGATYRCPPCPAASCADASWCPTARSALFSGVLREQVDIRGRGASRRRGAATALRGGRPRGAPGRARLAWSPSAAGRSPAASGSGCVLARALAADPEVLVLVEPTSAVDAHTEARIADRLATHRAGRTTVVTTTSPLLLDRVDSVAFLRGGTGGRVRARTASCCGRMPDYRAVVTREVEEEVTT